MYYHGGAIHWLGFRRDREVNLKFVVVIVVTFAVAFITMSFVRLVGWPYWSFHVLAILAGVVCYVASAILTKHFIEKNASDSANDDEMIPGVKNWQLTAGLGIVPQWVSLIGLIGLGLILASPFELFASFFR